MLIGCRFRMRPHPFSIPPQGLQHLAVLQFIIRRLVVPDGIPKCQRGQTTIVKCGFNILNDLGWMHHAFVLSIIVIIAAIIIVAVMGISVSFIKGQFRFRMAQAFGDETPVSRIGFEGIVDSGQPGTDLDQFGQKGVPSAADRSVHVRRRILRDSQVAQHAGQHGQFFGPTGRNRVPRERATPPERKQFVRCQIVSDMRMIHNLPQGLKAIK
mmetsp:Transcript_25070/g.46465  ORF Transcript_25070/g.46465 Transcript_25070/m.46465 type:complete len:212 (+) Transcript_25070:287-922(+)